MRYFELTLLAAATLAATTVSMSARSEETSMFKTPASIAGTDKTEKMLGMKPYSIHQRADGSLVIEGRMHRGGGATAQIILPKIQPSVTINGPAGVDENGNPVTWKERRDRKIVNALVFEALKKQGYTLEGQKKKTEGLKTQADLWKEKTEATREYVKKNGPITTKSFIIPGSTPQLSAQLENPDVSVRMENGKRVYYLNGKRLQIYPDQKPQTRRPLYQATRETTRIKVSERELPESEKTKKGKGAAKAAGQELVIERLPDRQKTPPTQAYVSEEKQDHQQNPLLDTVIDPKALPGVDDVERSLREAFPDLVPSDAETQTQIRGRGKPSASLKVLDAIAGILFGVSEAHASETETGQEKTVPFNPYLGKYGDVVSEITAGAHTIEEQVTGKGRSEEKKANPALPSYMDTLTAEGNYFDPARFAAEVVNKTNSLTVEQFNEDAAAVVGALTGKASPVEALADLLESNPEIYTAIPDADKRLQAVRGQLAEIAPANPLGEQTFIFISYSLTDAAIKDILELNKDRKDVTLVMRGVPEGMNIPEGVKRLQRLTEAVPPGLPIIIDPRLFKEYGITQVPAVVRAMRSPSPLTVTPNENAAPKPLAKMVAKVTGLNNDAWLKSQIESGERGDLGVQGNTYAINEPDLIEEMKKRAAMIDWEKKKQAAVKNFWKKRQFKVFPTAETERLREIDPTILVERDLTDLAGRKIRKAGDRVNPLMIRPFTQTILIFNPMSEDEMERVEAFRAAHKASGKSGLVLIATQMNKEASWDGYEKLTDRLDAHVFMMTPEVEYQWRIEKTPAVVTADNTRHVFLVRELGPQNKKEQYK